MWREQAFFKVECDPILTVVIVKMLPAAWGKCANQMISHVQDFDNGSEVRYSYPLSQSRQLRNHFV